VARNDHSRVGRRLGALQRTAALRGVFGGSRRWFWVFVGTWLVRRGRRALGREPVVVYREELPAGQGFRIEHLAETYAGEERGPRRRFGRRR
jgi:hypothetical protein